LVLLEIVLAALAVATVVAVVRIVVGPTDADRALGVDYGFAVFVAAVAVLAVRLDQVALIDLVLAGTLVGFLGTVAIAKLVERRTDR
jgi:multicomponent Na+:H+ antiporter subunit F